MLPFDGVMPLQCIFVVVQWCFAALRERGGWKKKKAKRGRGSGKQREGRMRKMIGERGEEEDDGRSPLGWVWLKENERREKKELNYAWGIFVQKWQTNSF